MITNGIYFPVASNLMRYSDRLILLQAWLIGNIHHSSVISLQVARLKGCSPICTHQAPAILVLMSVTLYQVNICANTFQTVVCKSRLYWVGDHCFGLGCSALRTFADLSEFVRRRGRCNTGQYSEVNLVAFANSTQSTASDSVLVTVVAARSRYQVEHPDCKAEELVVYTTTQTHSIGTKAGLVLGLQVRALEVRAEDRYSLRGDTLRSALMDDEALGRKPFIISTFCCAGVSAHFFTY